MVYCVLYRVCSPFYTVTLACLLTLAAAHSCSFSAGYAAAGQRELVHICKAAPLLSHGFTTSFKVYTIILFLKKTLPDTSPWCSCLPTSVVGGFGSLAAMTGPNLKVSFSFAHTSSFSSSLSSFSHASIEAKRPLKYLAGLKRALNKKGIPEGLKELKEKHESSIFFLNEQIR
jgi:hypothetical protein